MIDHWAQTGVVVLAICGGLPARAVSQTPPPDRPQTLDSAARACLHRASEPRIERAVATLPAAIDRFQAGLGQGRQFFVTVRIFDPQGREEQVFVSIDSVRADTLVGRLDSDIGLVSEFHRGNRFLVLRDAVIDWTITQPDGTEEGNLLGKMMDTLQERMVRAPSAHICALLPPP
jgi:hypothetical protein